jgi:hypothetical protein
MQPTFHERQYELAANLEAIAGSGSFFAPMQIVEESVGYDIALVPGHAAVWSQLGFASTPGGVATPIAYGPQSAPVPGGLRFAASLFLQYKRPERMVRANALEAAARRSQGGGLPFFRVRLNADQHAVLLELEQRVAADAVVRYAAPRFHQIEDLWVRQSTRAVFAGSTFIAPSHAGSPPSCWTYDDTGAPIFCSEARRAEGESVNDVLRALIRRDRPSRTAHLRALASEVGALDLSQVRRRSRIDEFDERIPSRERGDEEGEYLPPPLARSEWVERLGAAAPRDVPLDLEVAVDAAVVANAASAIGVTWLLADIQTHS